VPFICAAPRAPFGNYDDNAGLPVAPSAGQGRGDSAPGEVGSALVWVAGAVTHL
jgi:hypothetical protein